MIEIYGSKNSYKGTYQVTVVAREVSLGVENREAIFILEAKPVLKLLQRPEEYDEERIFQVTDTVKLPVPKYSTKNKLAYRVVDRDDENQVTPHFVTVHQPKHTFPYI
jgi:hypothetical protein